LFPASFFLPRPSRFVVILRLFFNAFHLLRSKSYAGQFRPVCYSPVPLLLVEKKVKNIALKRFLQNDKIVRQMRLCRARLSVGAYCGIMMFSRRLEKTENAPARVLV